MTGLVVILMTALSVFLAVLSKRAVDRPSDVHSILFKLLVNHFIAMNVISMMLQQITSSSTDISPSALGWSKLFRGSFDWGTGTIPSHSRLWSMECLAALVPSGAQQALLNLLIGAGHTEYTGPTMADSRGALKETLKQTKSCLFSFGAFGRSF